MGKKIMCIGIGVALFFILSIILSTSMIGLEEVAVLISAGVCGVYFIMLTVIAYAKNIVKYLKTGCFPETSGFATWVININKENNKLVIFTYTLFYIALWSFLGYIFYNFIAQPSELNSISEILLSIAFVSVIIPVFIILIIGIVRISKSTKTTMKNRENEYQKLKETNKFVYDLMVFKKHYAKIYYTLAYIGIIDAILIELSILYTEISGNYIPGSIGFGMTFIMLFEVFYLPIFFPVIIHTLKMNSKRQQITLNPLKIKMITRDGNDGYGTYEKIEKNYFVDVIETYQITNRYIIINGKIKSIIDKTEDSATKEKSKIINQLKIPRVFNNETEFAEYLKNTVIK